MGEAADDYTMGEFYAGLRQERQERGAERRDHAPRVLAEEGVNIARIENNGAHIIIHHAAQHVDFWPASGLWIVRETKERRRGLWPLIRHCQKAAKRVAQP